MNEPTESIPLPLQGVSGIEDVVRYFGYWPSFHDAEVVSLHMNRIGDSELTIYTFRTTPEIDDRGYYVQDKHALVTVRLSEIQDLQLDGFSPQNVIFGLTIEKVDDTFNLRLAPCYGMAGALKAGRIAFRLASIPSRAAPIDKPVGYASAG